MARLKAPQALSIITLFGHFGFTAERAMKNLLDKIRFAGGGGSGSGSVSLAATQQALYTCRRVGLHYGAYLDHAVR